MLLQEASYTTLKTTKMFVYQTGKHVFQVIKKARS